MKSAGFVLGRLFLVACLAIFWLGTGPGWAASINDYQPKNEAEREIIQVLMTLRDETNAGNWDKVLDLFASEKTVVVSQEGKRVPVAEYRRSYLKKHREEFLQRDCSIQFDPPTLMVVEADKAFLKVGRAKACAPKNDTDKYYVRIEPMWFNLIKTAEGWRITDWKSLKK